MAIFPRGWKTAKLAIFPESVLEDGPNGHLPQGWKTAKLAIFQSVLEDGPNGHLPSYQGVWVSQGESRGV